MTRRNGAFRGRAEPARVRLLPAMRGFQRGGYHQDRDFRAPGDPQPAWKLFWCLLAMLVFADSALPAQTVQGVLVSAATGEPLPGAILVLLDETGAQRRTSLSDAAGRFTISAPAPGQYRLRAERVGYAGTLSEWITLRAGEVREYRISAAADPVSLEGIVVRGKQRCEMRPQAGRATARVWEEARKALAASEWARRERSFRFQVESFTRELDPRELRVLAEETRGSSAYGIGSPFVSRSADELALHGFVWAIEGGRFYDYHAPDAEVLLSNAFLDTHCFHLTPPPEAAAGLVGLAFEPVRGRRVPDVRGTLWLDRRSANLRYLEYRYTGSIGDLPLDRAEGRIDFERLPNGAWIVRRWHIRMPQVVSAQVRLNSLSATQQRVIRFREEGGEVVRVLGAGEEWLDRPARATLTGVVFDSTHGAPLVGARVFLSGTQHHAATDSSGRFRLINLPSGRYSVGFLHPRLDSVGVLARTVEVALVAPHSTATLLVVPSVATIRAVKCPGAPAASGMLTGVVRDADGAAVPGSVVRVQWERPTRVGERAVVKNMQVARIDTDEHGRYHACGLPPQTPITVRAAAPEQQSELLTAKLHQGELQTVNVILRRERP